MNVIAHVIVGFNHGGTELQCQRLIANWPDNARHVVIALDSYGKSMRDVFANTNNVEAVESISQGSGRLHIFTQLRTFFISHHVTHVINHYFGITHVVSALAGRSCGIKRNLALSGNPTSGSIKFRVKCWIILLASYYLDIPIIACSQYVLGSLRSISLSLLESARYVYNGIEIPCLYDRSNKPAGRIVISMVARLDAIKDHETLIKAFALVKHSDAHLNIIGDGPLRETLEIAIASQSLIGRVHMMGSRSNILELLHNSDIFVFSTTEMEGFGIAIIEAMASTLPVIASNVSACREVLGGKYCGLVSSGNHVALAAALNDLIADPKQRFTLGAENWLRAKEIFSIENSARKFSEVLYD